MVMQSCAVYRQCKTGCAAQLFFLDVALLRCLYGIHFVGLTIDGFCGQEGLPHEICFGRFGCQALALTIQAMYCSARLCNRAGCDELMIHDVALLACAWTLAVLWLRLANAAGRQTQWTLWTMASYRFGHGWCRDRYPSLFFRWVCLGCVFRRVLGSREIGFLLGQ